MKFFTTEDNRSYGVTDYHEWIKGNFKDGIFWSEDSILLADSTYSRLNLYKFLAELIDGYDPYDNYEIDRELWEQMLSKADEIGGEMKELFEEATPWVEANYEENEVFTILGLQDQDL